MSAMQLPPPFARRGVAPFGPFAILLGRAFGESGVTELARPLRLLRATGDGGKDRGTGRDILQFLGMRKQTAQVQRFAHGA